MTACLRNVFEFSVNDTDVNQSWTHELNSLARPGNVLVMQMAIMSKTDIASIAVADSQNQRTVVGSTSNDYVALYTCTKIATGTSADDMAVTVTAVGDIFAYYTVVYELKLDYIHRDSQGSDIDIGPDTSCAFIGWNDLNTGNPTNAFGAFLAATYVDPYTNPPAVLTTNTTGMTIVEDTTFNAGTYYFQIRAGYLDSGATYLNGLSDFDDTLGSTGESLTLTQAVSGIITSDSAGMLQFSF